MLTEIEKRIAREAADEIEKCGWCQHTACNSEGNICVSEAIYRKLGPLGTENFWNIAEAITGMRAGLVMWNDHGNRTKEEVIGKLREIAK